MNLLEIRKYFYESKDYVIRIRKSSPDIVYYNGNKIFEIIKSNKDHPLETIKLIPNIFLINDATIKRIKKENPTIRDEDLKKEVINSLSSSRNLVKGLMYIKEDAKIILNKSSSTKFNEKNVIANLDNILNSFSFDKYFTKEIKNDDDKNELIYTLKLNKPYPNDNELTKLEYEILYAFVRDITYKIFKTSNGRRNGWCKPTFDLYDFKEIPLENLTINKNEQLVLVNNITNVKVNQAVNQYEKIAYEEEKNYQFLFMLKEDIINKKVKEFNNIFHFEQEYYNYETGFNRPSYEGEIDKKIAKGRIDNVFLNINDKGEGDLYLIELKYNDNVLGKGNGIHKHLIDMVKLLNSNSSIFKKRLITRVNYRIKTINDMNLPTPNELKSIKSINFWIIIGYEENKKNEIKKTLEEFNGIYDTNYSDIANFHNKITCFDNDVLKKYDLPEKSKLLKEHIKDLNNLNCDVKIFLDKVNTRTNENDPISLTENPFELWK